MAEKANHHFIPQLYLRNFSAGRDRRKAKVFCFDQSTNKTFETLVRNVGSRRHFFRINVEGLDPNHVEDGMAEIEGEIAPLLEEVIATRSFPSHKHFSAVMTLMGNVAVRNPRFRSMLEDLHVKMANGMMRAVLQDKERFRDSIKQARDNGAPIRDDISYEDMKSFIDRGEFNIAIDQTYLINLELDAVPTCVEQLSNWLAGFGRSLRRRPVRRSRRVMIRSSLPGLTEKIGAHTHQGSGCRIRSFCFRSRRSWRWSACSQSSLQTVNSAETRSPS
ncbi:DUF4238 domain-containing protein [Rhizobium leguminosarum]|nr:DUF4238 domain-containing protein [Rhizobium leguminosarum]MBY3031169.1 DUF4238 domain-containing protein [Rhizobium leguminosarum]